MKSQLSITGYLLSQRTLSEYLGSPSDSLQEVSLGRASGPGRSYHAAEDRERGVQGSFCPQKNLFKKQMS
jgi:hypothetical protein